LASLHVILFRENFHEVSIESSNEIKTSSCCISVYKERNLLI